MNILVVKSQPEKNLCFNEIFEELAKKGRSFWLWSNSLENAKFFTEKKWPQQRISLGTNLSHVNYAQAIAFCITFPFLILFYWIKLRRFAKSSRISSIICFDVNEKILLTLPAKFLKIKALWLQYSDLNKKSINPIILKMYSSLSGSAHLAAPTNSVQIQLSNLGFSLDNISVIAPGMRLNKFEHQENIFNSLAKKEYPGFSRKFFTIGTIADLDSHQKIENIFHAVNNCRNIIPNLQIIIIGDGPEKKNLSWLAKKLEIENFTWFIGSQEHLRKWLDSFDIFVAALDQMYDCDYMNLLKAMAAGLPVIGPNHLGLEEIVQENKTGSLIEINNSEMLSRQIIKLEQNQMLRKQLGRNAMEVVDKSFTIDKIAQTWEERLFS